MTQLYQSKIFQAVQRPYQSLCKISSALRRLIVFAISILKIERRYLKTPEDDYGAKVYADDT